MTSRFRLGVLTRSFTTIIPTIKSNLKGKTVKTIAIGDTAMVETKIDEEKILAFARVSGDFNPIHLDEEAAKQSRFGRRVAHGFLSASAFPTLFASCLPGSVYLSQSLKFKGPVFLGDTVRSIIIVTRVDPKPRNIGTVVTCTTTCTVEREKGVIKVVIDGSAEVLISGVKTEKIY